MGTAVLEVLNRKEYKVGESSSASPRLKWSNLFIRTISDVKKCLVIRRVNLNLALYIMRLAYIFIKSVPIIRKDPLTKSNK